MKRKVLIIVPSLAIGGQERQAVITAECLQGLYEVTLVVFQETQPQYPTKAHTQNLNLPPVQGVCGKLLRQLQRAWVLKKLRRSEKPIAVYSFGSTANLTNVLSSGTGKTIVSLREFAATARKFLNHIIFSTADVIVCQTIAMRNALLKNFPEVEKRAFVIYNAYDVTAIQNEAALGNVANAEPVSFLAVGRLTAVKGYSQLIKAFYTLSKRYPEALLTIIGDGEMRATLADFAASLHIESKIKLLGYISNPYMYMQRCYALIMTSITEGFPNVLVEAMACGAPVIATDCKSGPREILTSSYTEKTTKAIEYAEYGVLAPPFVSDVSEEPEKVQQLAQAMEQMMTDVTLRKHYAKAAQERSNAFSVEKYRNAIVKTLEGKEC